MTEGSSTAPPIKLHGTVHPESYFQILERTRLDLELWIDVLRGKVAGAIFRGAVPPDVCRQVCDNFWHSPVLKRPESHDLPRHSRGFVGASIYQPPVEEYLAEAEWVRQEIDALFAGTGDFHRVLLADLHKHLAEQGYILRLAEHRGRQAGAFKMRCWGNSGSFVLGPHDDAGVLQSPHLRSAGWTG